MAKRTFTVVIERDEEGWYIADVPELPGCHTQGKTKKELMKNIIEAIKLCLEVMAEKKEKIIKTNFIGIEKVAVHA